MADHSLTKRELSLTLNEENSYVKNRVEQKLLNKRLNFIRREHHYNNYLIKELTKSAENIHKLIRLSTGSIFDNNKQTNTKKSDTNISLGNKLNQSFIIVDI